MNKKVVYTCITGSYDIIREPKVITPDYDYICFTDNTGMTSDVWEIRPLPEETKGLSNVKKQRYVKINAHKVLPEYDMSLWIDANITIKKDLNLFTAKYCNEEGSIFIPKHPSRNCIYKEAAVCIKIKKDTAENINPQIEYYKSQKFPKDYGMVQSNIILRKHHNPDCVRLMEAWWELLKKYSHRDQLSFNYALWKNPTKEFVYIDKNACRCEYLWWDILHGTKTQKTSFTKKTINPSTKNKKKETHAVSDKQEAMSSVNKNEMEMLAAPLREDTAKTPARKYYNSRLVKKTIRKTSIVRSILSQY